jgi:choice-of-anchor C domain-containing protein
LEFLLVEAAVAARKSSMKTVAALVIGSLFALSASAAPFHNGSFETGTVTPCNTFNVPAGSNTITGWTVSAGNLDWLGSPPGCGWQPSHGSASLDLVGSAAGGIGGIQQTFDTVPGTGYVLSFDLAGNFGAGPVVKPLAVTINGVTTNFTFDTTGRGAANMGWTTHSIAFVATGTSSTVNFVSDVSAAGGTLNAGAALDNVRVALASGPVATAEIPLDWAHWAAMLGIALMSFVVLASRRRAMRAK